MNINIKELDFIKPLINIIEDIEYGWIDKNNNKHYIVDETYANNYKLQSPEGSCSSGQGYQFSVVIPHPLLNF